MSVSKHSALQHSSAPVLPREVTNGIHTLCSQLGAIGTSERVVDEPLELIVAAGLYDALHILSIPQEAQGSNDLLQRFVVYVFIP